MPQTPGDLRAVAIVNSATPGIAGTTIKNFPGLVYASNGEGEVLVRATVEGGGVSSDDDTVLWVSRPDSVQQIAREGEDAPGVPGGGTFKDLTFLPLSINAEGSVCFKAGIDTGDIATNAAIFAIDHADELGQGVAVCIILASICFVWAAILHLTTRP